MTDRQPCKEIVSCISNGQASQHRNGSIGGKFWFIGMIVQGSIDRGTIGGGSHITRAVITRNNSTVDTRNNTENYPLESLNFFAQLHTILVLPLTPPFTTPST
jgi:hypothetical protein